MNYIEATEAQLKDFVDLELKLFPEETRPLMEKYCRTFLASEDQTAFLCYEGSRPIGHVHASLRKDYVEGTDSSPVGYLEAIFVEPDFRGRGIARELARLAERWAAGKGCSEMGSDTYAENLDSQAFHARIGYRIAGRLVAFTKKIDEKSETS